MAGNRTKRTIAFFMILMILFSACSKEKTTTWQEQYDLGSKYLSEGKYEEALLAFTAAIAIDPAHHEAYMALSVVYEANGDTKAAINILQKGVDATGNEKLVKKRDKLSGQAVSGENSTAGQTSGTSSEAASGNGSTPGNGTVAAGGQDAGNPGNGTVAAGSQEAGNPGNGTVAAGNQAAGNPGNGTSAEGSPSAGTPDNAPAVEKSRKRVVVQEYVYEPEMNSNVAKVYEYDEAGRQVRVGIYRDGFLVGGNETTYDLHGNIILDRLLRNRRFYDFMYEYVYQGNVPVSMTSTVTVTTNGVSRTEQPATIRRVEGDADGRITAFYNAEGQRVTAYAYDSSGNRVLSQVFDNSGTMVQETATEYTEYGLVKRVRETVWKEGGKASEQVTEYHFDKEGYAVACDIASDSDTTTYQVVSMDLENYLAEKAEREESVFHAASMAGTWQLVAGLSPAGEDIGKLKIAENGKITLLIKSSSGWADTNGNSGTSVTYQVAETAIVEMTSSRLNIWVSEDGDSGCLKGRYYVDGSVICYLIDEVSEDYDDGGSSEEGSASQPGTSAAQPAANGFLTVNVGQSVVDLSRPFEELASQIYAEGLCFVDPILMRMIDADGEYSKDLRYDREELERNKNSFFGRKTASQMDSRYCESSYYFGLNMSYSFTPSFIATGGITKYSTMEEMAEKEFFVRLSQGNQVKYAAFFIDGEAVDLGKYQDDLEAYTDQKLLELGAVRAALKEDYPYNAYVNIAGSTISSKLGYYTTGAAGNGQAMDRETIRNLMLLYLAGAENCCRLERGEISNCGMLVCQTLGGGIELVYTVITFQP